jgi:hypothetical protein
MEEAEEALAAATAERLRHAAPEAQSAPAAPPTSHPLLEEVREFVAARCTVDEAAAASEVILRARYCAWAEEHGQEPLNPQQFTDALDQAGFPVRGGKRRGLCLKLLRDLATEELSGVTA